ncbi:MAG: peptidylprolyl isomerase [Bernardetiaceae bacterium]
MPRIALIKTHLATFQAELYDQETPLTVDHFCRLAQRGFYDNRLIFKVIPRTLFQTGCPNDDGTGSAGVFVPCERDGERQYHDIGVLSMAHTGRNRASSQFFVCLARRTTEHFDGNHTCFGRIKNNIELLDNFVCGDMIEHIQISSIPDR